MAVTNLSGSEDSSIYKDIWLEDYFFWTMYTAIGIGILVGNSFTMAVFLSNYNLRHAYMNLFLVSLAGSDILMAIFVLPGFASFCSKTAWRKIRECDILEGPKDFVFLASVFNLLAITYDRYLAVLRPLHYYRKMTRSKLTVILLAVWLVPFPLTLMRTIILIWLKSSALALKIYDALLVTCVVLLPIIVMLAVNIKIVKAIRRHKVKINVQVSSSEIISDKSGLDSGLNSPMPSEFRAVTPLDLPTTSHYELKVPGLESEKERRNSYRIFNRNSERKGTMTCLFIVLAFVVFWLPRALYNLFDTFGLHDLNSETFIKVSNLCMFTQSLINPFIYSFYRKDFRLAAKKLLKLV